MRVSQSGRDPLDARQRLTVGTELISRQSPTARLLDADKLMLREPMPNPRGVNPELRSDLSDCERLCKQRGVGGCRRHPRICLATSACAEVSLDRDQRGGLLGAERTGWIGSDRTPELREGLLDKLDKPRLADAEVVAVQDIAQCGHAHSLAQRAPSCARWCAWPG